MAIVHEALLQIAAWLIVAFEIIGIGIILIGALNTLRMWLRQKPSSVHMRYCFGQTLAFGLLFLLAGEILKMTVVDSREDAFVLGVVVVLHVAVSILVGYENNHAYHEIQQENKR